MIRRLMLGLFVLALVASCNDAPPAADPTPTPDDAGLAFVVASADGVQRVGADDSVETLTDTPAAAAYEAGELVVFQELDDNRRGRIRVGEGRVFTSEDVLVEPGEDTVHLALHGLATVDGRRVAIVTEVTGRDPEAQVETLSTVDVLTGERRDIAETGGWEDWASTVSHADGVFVLFRVAGVTSSTMFVDVDGETVEVDDDPLPEPCPDDVTCPANVVTDDDGGHFAWTAAIEADDGTFQVHVFVTRRADGESLLVAPLPAGFGLSTLELAGDVVLVNPWSAGVAHAVDPQPALVYELGDDNAEPRALPVAGYATPAQL